MCVRIAHLAGLRFSATQIFSQFGGQFRFARHIVALIFTHGKCFAAIRLQAQALRRSRRAIGLTLRPCMTIGAPAFYKAVCIAPEWALPERRGSSVVERTLGKGEAESSILSRGTISLIDCLCEYFRPQGVLLRSRQFRRLSAFGPVLTIARRPLLGWKADLIASVLGPLVR